MNIFVRAWRGEASLAVAFWIIYVLFGIIIGAVIALIYMAAIPNFNYMKGHSTIVATYFPWTLYSAVCVWRCGKNSAFIWRWLARIFVVIGVIGGLLNLYDLSTGQSLTRPETTVKVESTTA